MKNKETLAVKKLRIFAMLMRVIEIEKELYLKQVLVVGVIEPELVIFQK